MPRPKTNLRLGTAAKELCIHKKLQRPAPPNSQQLHSLNEKLILWLKSLKIQQRALARYNFIWINKEAMKKNLLILGALVFTAISCTTNKYTVFTESLKKEYRWSDRELTSLQFYVSQPIVLYKVVRDGESNIVDGKVVVRDGEKIDQIVIKKGTPGILVYNPRYDRFGVSFESTGQDKYLMFGPAADRNGAYMLLAKEWKDGYGLVTYGDEVYRTNSGSAFASLLIQMDKLNKTSYRTTEAAGREVSKN